MNRLLFKRILVCQGGWGEEMSFSFLDTVIETKDHAGESKINLTNLDKIIETGDYFYVCLQSGEIIVIPKAKVDNIHQVRQHLQQISQQLNITYTQQLDWKWR